MARTLRGRTLRGRTRGSRLIMAALSKSEQAYRLIRERIDSGRYVPGFRLVLAPIAGELGMSVVPVREAIRRLEAEGLVTFELNVGAQVALLEETEYQHTMETLALVEGAATAFMAPSVTADQLRRAAEINERMRQSLEDFDPHRFTELNLEFPVLFETCPNTHVLRSRAPRLEQAEGAARLLVQLRPGSSSRVGAGAR